MLYIVFFIKVCSEKEHRLRTLINPPIYILNYKERWIPQENRSSRQSHRQGKWCARSFGIGGVRFRWISWSQVRLSILNATRWHWLSWKPTFPKSGQRSRQPFACNTIMLDSIPVWRPQCTLPRFSTFRLPSLWAYERWTTWVKVNCLCWCRLLRERHTGSCSSLAKVHNEWWWFWKNNCK
jgi:hypothetical protein